MQFSSGFTKCKLYSFYGRGNSNCAGTKQHDTLPFIYHDIAIHVSDRPVDSFDKANCPAFSSVQVVSLSAGSLSQSRDLFIHTCTLSPEPHQKDVANRLVLYLVLTLWYKV